MSKTLQIQIAEDDEQQQIECKSIQKESATYFLQNLKDTLAELYLLPLDEVVQLVQSDDFKDDRERIEHKFWDTFDCISKEDDSLDSAILLQHFGFKIRKQSNILETIQMLNRLDLE